MITYSATLDVPVQLVHKVSKLLSDHRKEIGTRKGTRALTCYRQAKFLIAWFRDKADIARLGRGFGISQSTAYRYKDEGVAVLAAKAPTLEETLDKAAGRLDVSAETGSVIRRENVFYADDDPVHRVTTYIPWSIAEGTGLLEEEVPHQFGIHGVLEEQGHTMTRIREEVSTRMPRPDEVRSLQLGPGVPVLDVWHTSIDQNHEPYELTRFVMRGDMTGLLYDVPVE